MIFPKKDNIREPILKPDFKQAENHLIKGYEDITTQFDREARQMINGHCPQCESKDIHIVRKTTRKGHDTSVICHRCGYIKSILGHENYLKTDETCLKVRINGKPTNLIVDHYSIENDTVELSAHTKPLEFPDLINTIKNPYSTHKKRTINQITKIINNQLTDKHELISLNYDNAYLSIIMNYHADSECDYREIFSKVLNIPDHMILILNYVPAPSKWTNSHKGQYTILIDCNKYPLRNW